MDGLSKYEILKSITVIAFIIAVLLMFLKILSNNNYMVQLCDSINKVNN